MKERKREGGKESERERETHADYFLFDILTFGVFQENLMLLFLAKLL